MKWLAKNWGSISALISAALSAFVAGSM